MDVEVIEGRIVALGDNSKQPANDTYVAVYTYVELESGRAVRQLRSQAGVDGHLRRAFEAEETVQLHVASGGDVPNPAGIKRGPMPKGATALLAIRRGDGRLYSIAPPEATSGFQFGSLILVALGVCLLPFFGLGLLFLGGAGLNWKSNAANAFLRRYVEGLPQAIAV